jgi:hypothetical protein
MKEETVKNVNVFLVGLSFLLVFTAFQTMGNIQELILDTARQVSLGCGQNALTLRCSSDEK